MDKLVTHVVERFHASSGRQFVAHVTGGCSQLLSWLTGVPGASNTLLEATVPYATASSAQLVPPRPNQTYVSAEFCEELALVAFKRAQNLSAAAALRQLRTSPVVGLACSASLVSAKPKRGLHHAFVSVRSTSHISSYHLVLDKNLGRSRWEEDDLLSRVALQALLRACQMEVPSDLVQLGEGDSLHSDERAVLSPLDAFFQQEAQMVLFDSEEQQAQFQDVSVTDAIVLPGSFNPLHHGHLGIALSASSLLPNISQAVFELSVENVAKPPLSPETVVSRAGQFSPSNLSELASKLGRSLPTSETLQTYLAVTRAPLFRDKLKYFQRCTFAVGYDTAIRVVDPTFYQGSEQLRDLALEAVHERGCRFLVACRQHDGQVKSLADVHIPSKYAHLFIELPVESFRVDVSSTELRRQMAEKGNLEDNLNKK